MTQLEDAVACAERLEGRSTGTVQATERSVAAKLREVLAEVQAITPPPVVERECVRCGRVCANREELQQHVVDAHLLGSLRQTGEGAAAERAPVMVGLREQGAELRRELLDTDVPDPGRVKELLNAAGIVTTEVGSAKDTERAVNTLLPGTTTTEARVDAMFRLLYAVVGDDLDGINACRDVVNDDLDGVGKITGTALSRRLLALPAYAALKSDGVKAQLWYTVAFAARGAPRNPAWT